MLNLKSLLLLALISFSVQFEHCYANFEICLGDSSSGSSNTLPTPTIQNCVFQPEDTCYQCKEGFVPSTNGKSCISSPYCEEIDEDDTKCKECEVSYYPNKNGQCERTLCSLYKDNVCKECYPGYYLKGTECKRITIPHCLEWDETKCTKCDYYATLSNDGKCTVRANLIKGCYFYDDNGKCNYCDEDSGYKLNNNGSCDSNNCKNGQKTEYCGVCETGYYTDPNDGKCMGYDGTKDIAALNQIGYVLLIVILALLL